MTENPEILERKMRENYMRHVSGYGVCFFENEKKTLVYVSGFISVRGVSYSRISVAYNNGLFRRILNYYGT